MEALRHEQALPIGDLCYGESWQIVALRRPSISTFLQTGHIPLRRIFQLCSWRAASNRKPQEKKDKQFSINSGLGLVRTQSEGPIICIIFLLYIQGHHVDSMKLGMMVLFTPRKSANATNQVDSWLLNIYQHTAGLNIQSFIWFHCFQSSPSVQRCSVFPTPKKTFQSSQRYE